MQKISSIYYTVVAVVSTECQKGESLALGRTTPMHRYYARFD